MTATCGSETRDVAGEGCGCAPRAVPSPLRTLGRIDAPWTEGVLSTVVGDFPRARTALGLRDRLGTLKARAAVGRMRYRVPPGLYAVGAPTADSVVLVSANYKLSFDHLRRVLTARDAWILVLDTGGINVWCAAGKGTFGTAEIVRRVHGSGLARIVSHRKLVVPQLGAPGVAAHEVHRATGFRVVYGPVRADDLPAFLDARMKARPDMRRVLFRLRDRLALVPVELVTGARYALPVAAALLLLGGLSPGGYSVAALATTGGRDVHRASALGVAGVDGLLHRRCGVLGAGPGRSVVPDAADVKRSRGGGGSPGEARAPPSVPPWPQRR